MRLVRSTKSLQQVLDKARAKGASVGFVPTMGYLHEGHLSLVRLARRLNDVVVVSIFVNPAQFGPKEDFRRYPRNLKRDAALLRRAKVDFLFAPSVMSVYPKSFDNWVEPGLLARRLCGLKRPGHFRGVATVVKRLFEMVKPDRAYFGQKDYQQTRIIQEMVKRLRMSVRVSICPTVREKDGLAMSSRNVYLTKEERIRAVSISASLRLARYQILNGARGAESVCRLIRKNVSPYVQKIDYVEAVDAAKLKPISRLRGLVLIAVACFVGRARLIDNILVRV